MQIDILISSTFLLHTYPLVELPLDISQAEEDHLIRK